MRGYKFYSKEYCLLNFHEDRDGDFWESESEYEDRYEKDASQYFNSDWCGVVIPENEISKHLITERAKWMIEKIVKSEDHPEYFL